MRVTLHTRFGCYRFVATGTVLCKNAIIKADRFHLTRFNMALRRVVVRICWSARGAAWPACLVFAGL